MATHAAADGADVHAAIVDSNAAKRVKDVLKARGWLHPALKPGGAGPGRIAFPLAPAVVGDARAAIASSDVELASVEEISRFDAGALTVKKPPPPQKTAKKPKAPPTWIN